MAKRKNAVAAKGRKAKGRGSFPLVTHIVACPHRGTAFEFLADSGYGDPPVAGKLPDGERATLEIIDYPAFEPLAALVAKAGWPPVVHARIVAVGASR